MWTDWWCVVRLAFTVNCELHCLHWYFYLHELTAGVWWGHFYYLLDRYTGCSCTSCLHEFSAAGVLWDGSWWLLCSHTGCSHISFQHAVTTGVWWDGSSVLLGSHIGYSHISYQHELSCVGDGVWTISVKTSLLSRLLQVSTTSVYSLAGLSASRAVLKSQRVDPIWAISQQLTKSTLWIFIYSVMNWLLVFGETALRSCLVITLVAGLFLTFLNWLPMSGELDFHSCLVPTLVAVVPLSFMNWLLVSSEVSF